MTLLVGSATELRRLLVARELSSAELLEATLTRIEAVNPAINAVVVVEANQRSGSLITARCALEQGRDVMAVPGSVLGGRNRGSHALLKDGAKVVESADDILEELGWPALRSASGALEGP